MKVIIRSRTIIGGWPTKSWICTTSLTRKRSKAARRGEDEGEKDGRKDLPKKKSGSRRIVRIFASKRRVKQSGSFCHSSRELPFIISFPHPRPIVMLIRIPCQRGWRRVPDFLTRLRIISAPHPRLSPTVLLCGLRPVPPHPGLPRFRRPAPPPLHSTLLQVSPELPPLLPVLFPKPPLPLATFEA